jgi:hypothetical protein
MLRNPAVTGDARKDGYFNGETAILLPKRTGYPLAPDALKGKSRVKALFQQEPKRKIVITSSTKVKIKSGLSGQLSKYAVGDFTKGSIIEDYGEHSVAYYEVEIENAPSEMEGKFIVTFDDLVPDPDQISQLASSAAQVPDIPAGFGASSPPSDPFSPEQNAIVRSFQSVQGKGLGGVITGLAFSDLTAPNITWETSEFGSRAPKMLTCNMTFAVIHDIAPGIDEKGFNRGFQYPVGNAVRHLMGDNKVVQGNNAETKFNSYHLDAASDLRNANAKGSSTKGFPGGL